MSAALPVSNFTARDILQHSASLSLEVEPSDISATVMETPFFAGQLLVREVQPGLTVTASDVTYLTDEEVIVNVDTALSCGFLLEGDAEEILIGEKHRVRKRLNCPVLVGYGTRSSCRWRPALHHRSIGSGFMIKPSFFDRFADDITDDGLITLRNFIAGGIQTETLPCAPALADRARLALSHPYNGQLGQLFLESNTLYLVTEIADQLKRQTKLVSKLGRRHYDRVIEASDFLDRNLNNPPTSLEIARRVGMNITTLQANFKTVFGTTIFGYVRRQRLSIAQILMLEHKLTVAEAGRRVGYASPSAFAAAYKRQFGYSPTQEDAV
ncbi:AraC family transcriptional regulator [Brucella pseudogrignonensis]|uniref:AraC-like DNA-binding protein n=1 Tax=Brucella pseudogrignonensis TaxID=419475 RepID=A0ABU1MBY1_9HYPH|nr:AraC family transcriptional regulator [Brucella pseudogrignonensis]MDR6433347.1 AraC-like DNA-binding protein [Brucella pseudogrignonensis]